MNFNQHHLIGTYPLLIALGLILTSIPNYAENNNNQCFSNNYIADLPFNSTEELKINSDIAKKINDKYIFLGEVIANNKNKAIQSQKIDYDQTTGQFKTSESSRFKSRDFLAKSSQPIEFNLKTYHLNARDVDFEIQTNNAAGFSKEVYSIKNQENFLYLTNLTYTFCDIKNSAWVIEADKAQIDSNKQRIKLNNAILKIKDIPLFWIPYVDFPLNDRASGLLFPEIQIKSYQGDTRYVYIQPYYFNLASNYDLTTEVIVDSIYGEFLSAEFRYLEKNHKNNLKVHWLGNQTSDLSPNNQERWFLNLTQSGQFSLFARPVTYDLDMSEVSDINYINQFKPFGRADTSRILSTLNFFQHTNFVNYYVNFQDSQRLKSNGHYYVKNNHLLADIKAIELNQGWNLDPKIDISTFNRPDEMIKSDNFTGERIYSESKLHKQYQSQGYLINSEIKFTDRRYFLDVRKNSNPDDKNNQNSQSSVVKLDSKLMLERDASESIVQNVDIRMLYVKSDVKEDIQAKHPTFDTALLSESSYLFRDNRYSGLDRQSKDNKIALSVYTAFFDKKPYKRIIDFKVAQAYYFDSFSQYMDENNQLKDRHYSDIYISSNYYFDPFVISGVGQIDANNNQNAWTQPKFKSYRLTLSQNKLNPKFSLSYYQDSSYHLLNSNLQYQMGKNKINIISTHSLDKNQAESFGFNLLRDDCCYKIGASLSKKRKSDNLFETEIRLFVEFEGLGTLRFR